MFSSLFSVFSALLLGFSYLAGAAPVQPVEMIAFAPTITSPKGGEVWPTSSQQTVGWATDNVPSEIQDTTVIVLLGYSANDSENLDYKNPLASGVPIMDGTVQITVPQNLTLRTDYIIVLIGDSGDASNPFTILPTPSLN